MNKKKFGLIIVMILLLAILGFVIWASFPLGPSQVAKDSLVSNDKVTVEIGDFITFTPTMSTPTTGLIFYPGGHVAEESYAPLAQLIAAQGFFVIIVPMPLNLAVFSPNKASDVIAKYPSITTWAISGHSLGGSMAASFIYNNPGVVSALYLLASYPANSNNISSQAIQVLTIYGTNDQVLSVSINDTLSLLPSTTQVIPIKGGIHAYFGNYGPQPGDGKATISREQQQNITSTAIVISLQNL